MFIAYTIDKNNSKIRHIARRINEEDSAQALGGIGLPSMSHKGKYVDRRTGEIVDLQIVDFGNPVQLKVVQYI